MGHLYEVNIDYVTITEKDAETWNMMLRALEVETFHNLQTMEHTWEEKRTMGYSGSQLGPCFVGSRKDSSMIRCSGAWAANVLFNLKNAGFQPHVTRLDIQATIVFEGDRMLYAEEAKAQVLHYQENTPRRSHPQVTLISTAGRGDTLQIGARSSEVFCRIYDKWREQRLDYEAYAWRFEVECKGTVAQDATRAILSSHSWRDEILGMVRGTFEQRGVREPLLSSKVLTALAAKKYETTDEKRLKWIETDVAPTIRKLWEHGFQEELLALFSYMC